ncbi:MAG: hypothetical protein JO025_22050 [Verrucomicrobia bacterium]|nr:hypothetical protein [Verrucomicrobiota bacterium]
MEKLSKTYTLAHSPDGWRMIFSTGITPDLGLKPHHSLFEVIDRVATLYPEYQPRFTVEQLGDYLLQVDRRGYAQELQKIISQTSGLKDGLIDLIKKLPEIGAGQDRGIAEDLITLHHQLSDLRANVDIARREVVRAKKVGQRENEIGRDGLRFPPFYGFIRGFQAGRIPGPRGMER